MVLGSGSVYATIIIARTAFVSVHSLSMTTGPADPARIASVLMVLGIFATIPAAFALAWPLLHVATDRDRPAAFSRDS